jgi:uncharacterized membrane protein SpoIIM required for sporulation
MARVGATTVLATVPTQVDIDRFIAQNQRTWDRLAELTAAARRGPHRLGPAGVEELVRTYQATSTHLSHARTAYDDPGLVARLSQRVAAAAGTIYGAPTRSRASALRFFTTTFPAAIWHIRRQVAAAAALLLVPGVIMGAWVGLSDAALRASAPEAVREAYVAEDFEAYYSSDSAWQFATEVTVNNIQVSFLAFAAGILFCVLTAFILAFNGANVGVAAGLFVAAGEQGKFWGFIIPHGLLELSAVVVAGGAGLALGWAVIAPGERTRGVALAEEGRRAAIVVMGLMLTFVAAGFIEGFITGRGVPTPLRVAVGVAAFVAFWSWTLLGGRRAAAEGYTGTLGEHDHLERAKRLGMAPSTGAWTGDAAQAPAGAARR